MAAGFDGGDPVRVSDGIAATTLTQLKSNLEAEQTIWPGAALAAFERIQLDNPNPAP
jgi:aryl-alcohol dehydrogenase-like predicted oxidoreductase